MGVAVAETELASSLLAMSSGVGAIPFNVCSAVLMMASDAVDFSVSSVELAGAEPAKGKCHILFEMCEHFISLIVSKFKIFCFLYSMDFFFNSKFK